MADGPTTVGSIVGQLKLDDSDLNTRLDAAEARAKEFEALDPTIKVKASVADAIAALESVNAAEKKLQATNAASDAATQRAILAQMRLNDVQNARGRTDYQVAAAEFALQQATERSDAAAEKAIAADDSLAAARMKLLAVTDALAASEGVEDEEENRGNDIKNEGFKRISAIVAAVAALIPLLGPLAAYSAAVGGGLLSMGVVGVLAVLGIKNAMAEGTETGREYSAGVQALKSDLDELSQTAATKMLGSFNWALATLQGAMPQLNSEVSAFAGILGGTGNAALTGAVASLRVLNPLFVQAGMYVGALALGFEKWTSDGGLQKFAAYAERSLPQVASLLGNLATSALNIVEALAPAGTAMVQFLNIIANVLDFLSGFGPGFAIVVAGATAGYTAFKLFGSITPLIQTVTEAVTGLGVAEQASLGPIGLVIAGVSALVAILGVSLATTESATNAVASYASAVEADNGVIGQNVKLQLAKNLQDSGSLAILDKLGVATNKAVDAALGDAAARKQVNAQILAGANALEAHDKASKSATNSDMLGIGAQADASVAYHAAKDAIEDNATAIQAAIKAYNDLQRAQGGATISTREQLQAQDDLAQQYGTSVSAYEGAVTANQKTAAQAAATTLQLQLENDAATLLTNAFTLLNGGSLDVAQAQTGVAAANNALSDSFKQNGKVIDGTTAAAVANQQALESQVSAAQAAAEAIGKQTGSSKDAVASYEASKTALENQLQAQGDLTAGVQAYINQLYDVANLKVPPTKLDADTSAAAAKVAALQAQFDALETTKTVHVDASTGALTIKWANGVEAHAAGGTVGGAGSSTSDSNLVRLSRGEEVIKASSAGQARPFLKAFNANPAAALSSVSGKQVHHHWQIITQSDPQAAVQDGIRRLSLLGA